MARAGRDILADADLLVPVPLHRFRLLQRRFNQSALLALAVSRLSGIGIGHDLLVRRRATRRQVGLGAAERWRNLAGAFAVPAERRPLVEGRRLVLIDDVLTSGATAEAATKALRRAGADRVDVLVFARVVTGL
jgi:ComF family protein